MPHACARHLEAPMSTALFDWRKAARSCSSQMSGAMVLVGPPLLHHRQRDAHELAGAPERATWPRLRGVHRPLGVQNLLINQLNKGLKTLIEFAGRTPFQFDLVIGQSVSPALCEGFPT